MSDITWIAHYTDGSQLAQANGTTYADIDRARLQAFSLLKEGQTILAIDFRDDTNGDPEIGPKRLIWRKRHLQSTGGANITIHLAGWQRKIAGRNVQSICYVNEDGAVVLGGQWMENQRLTGAIEPLECEADLA